MEYKFIKSEEIMDWEGRKRARFVNSLSGFKSATLIGTYHPEFGDNLSIVSSVVHLGSTPQLMVFLLMPPVEDKHNYKKNKYTEI